MGIIEALIVVATVIELLVQMPDHEDNWCGPPDTPEDIERLTHHDR